MEQAAIPPSHASDGDLDRLLEDGLHAIKATTSLDEVEQCRIAYLGKKGFISEQMRLLATMDVEGKKQFGQQINLLRDALEQALATKKQAFEEQAIAKRLQEEWVDVTLPTRAELQGSLHPIPYVIDELVAIFAAMGFSVVEGPEIEDEYHNFEALNTPAHHPARDMQDTFYLPNDANGKGRVLRTQTSSVQIRTMAQGKPPFKVVAPGKVFRSDYDLTHTPMFNQIEGLVIDKAVTMAELKACLFEFLTTFFEVEELPMRFRPSFFPFTEPSAEVDIGCQRKDGRIQIGQGHDWLEILGCGMVHPNVLRNVGVDPEEYQGFAFGLGVERLAMLKYGIPDLRTFFEADLRWLKHYGFKGIDVPYLAGGTK